MEEVLFEPQKRPACTNVSGVHATNLAASRLLFSLLSAKVPVFRFSSLGPNPDVDSTGAPRTQDGGLLLQDAAARVGTKRLGRQEIRTGAPRRGSLWLQRPPSLPIVWSHIPAAAAEACTSTTLV